MSNQPPTDDELTAIRARAEAATPGPWVMVHGDDEYSMNLYCVAPKSIAHKVDTEETIALDGVICGTLVQVPKTIGHNHNELNETVGPKWEENAEFIAHARTDIPALLAEVERLRTELREAIDDLKYTSRWALKYKTELEKYDPGWFIYEDSDEEIERFNREFDEQRALELAQSAQAEVDTP